MRRQDLIDIAELGRKHGKCECLVNLDFESPNFGQCGIAEKIQTKSEILWSEQTNLRSIAYEMSTLLEHYERYLRNHTAEGLPFQSMELDRIAKVRNAYLEAI